MLITALPSIPGLMEAPATYTGSPSPLLAAPVQQLEQTVPDSRPFVVSPFSATTANRLTTGQKIESVIGGILGAIGVSVSADKSGVSVMPTTTTVQDKAANVVADKAKEYSPLLFAGVAIIATVLLLRK